MGLLCDYFRAPDAETVIRVMNDDDGPVVRTGGHVFSDAVDAKSMDPTVVLGQLVAFALGTPWTPGLVAERPVWPVGDAEDPEYQGPWVVSLGSAARDALADVPEDRLPSLAQQWSGIEELSFGADTSAEELLPLVGDLVGLARRARGAGEDLYCWICL